MKRKKLREQKHTESSPTRERPTRRHELEDGGGPDGVKFARKRDKIIGFHLRDGTTKALHGTWCASKRTRRIGENGRGEEYAITRRGALGL